MSEDFIIRDIKPSLVCKATVASGFVLAYIHDLPRCG